MTCFEPESDLILKRSLFDEIYTSSDAEKEKKIAGHDPKHTAVIVKLWLLYNVPNQLHTPPQSPDLNPVKHLWDFLERKIRQYSIPSKDMLKSVLKDKW
ncbi:transposable element Tc1 transposase [Trichonephila clavipes]|nr:transposable element Tc1 transposase [Trichonephila clavipes]